MRVPYQNLIAALDKRQVLTGRDPCRDMGFFGVILAISQTVFWGVFTISAFF